MSEDRRYYKQVTHSVGLGTSSGSQDYGSLEGRWPGSSSPDEGCRGIVGTKNRLPIPWVWALRVASKFVVRWRGAGQVHPAPTRIVNVNGSRSEKLSGIRPGILWSRRRWRGRRPNRGWVAGRCFL